MADGQVADDALEDVRLAADKKKVAVTISLIGKIAYSTPNDLCLPDLPATKTYDQLTEILKGYYKPKVLEVAETYPFYHTIQRDNFAKVFASFVERFSYRMVMVEVGEEEQVARWASQLGPTSANVNF